MPFSCKFCSEKFCSEHRLPENHACGGLEEYKADKKKKDSEITYQAQREDEEVKHRRPSTLQEAKGMWRRLKRKARTLLGGKRRGRPGGPGVGQRRVGKSPTLESMQHAFPEIATFTLLAMIAGVFLLQNAVDGPTLGGLPDLGAQSCAVQGSGVTYDYLMKNFALCAPDILQEPWTLLTSIFMHAEGFTFHILVNAMVLFFFGTELERRVGTRRFLKIFFSAGILAGLGFVGFNYATASLFGGAVSPAPAVGASGALYGVFACLAIIAPEITVLAFLIIPMKIRTALVAFVVLDLFLLSQSTFVASSAHLSGAIVGLYYGFKMRDEFRGKIQFQPF
jgi:membrane associated rhomboid family serine protease